MVYGYMDIWIQKYVGDKIGYLDIWISGYLDIWIYGYMDKNDGRIFLGGGGLPAPPLKLPIDFMDTPHPTPPSSPDMTLAGYVGEKMTFDAYTYIHSIHRMLK